MARADRTGPGSHQPGRHRDAELARIRARFSRLGPQQRALVVAIESFSDDQGRFDRRSWEEAFASNEPETIHRVVGVIGTFERLVNHLNGMLLAGARLVQLSIADGHDAPSIPAIVNAIRDDGGLTRGEAEALVRLNRTRNRLQHASLDVRADELHADVELLLNRLRRIAKSYVEWLTRHGVQLLIPPARSPT